MDYGGTFLKHDCSTLGGNAGSCVVDLETNQVTGLHFAAERLEAGFAVVLSKLQNDPLMRKGKLELV